MRRGEDRADPRTQEVLVWNDLLPRRLTLMNSPAAAHQKPRYKSVNLDSSGDSPLSPQQKDERIAFRRGVLSGRQQRSRLQERKNYVLAAASTSTVTGAEPD
jgi:hypothetical protein